MLRFSLRIIILTFGLLSLFVLAGCTGHILPAGNQEKTTKDSRFFIVTVSEKDTFESLAGRYYQDRAQGWRIAAYNQSETLSAGQRIIIPRVPFQPGGLQVDGYQTVPVLVYIDMASKASRAKTVSAKDFERHLAYLRDNGHTTISLNQLDAFLNLRGDLPPHAVLICMDTTRQWAFDIAYRTLKQFGMRGALFFNVDQVGQKGNLTWKQLADMAANGISLGVLGNPFNAPAKESLASYLKSYEAALVRPRKAFQKKLNTACRHFAYASGKSDDLTISLLKKHGYRAGFTRQRGNNPFFIDNFAIKRSVVHGHHDLEKFRRSLTTFRSMELK